MPAVILEGEATFTVSAENVYPGLTVVNEVEGNDLSSAFGSSYPDDMKAIIHIEASPGMLYVDRAVVAPPDDVEYIERMSQVWPAPALDARGFPTNWEEPTSQTIEDWGLLQVIIAGEDVTFFRGIPCQVESFSSGEPFDDDVASIFFPQITSLEALPTWLGGEDAVEIKLIRPDGTKKTLWDGYLASDGDATDQGSFGTRVHCYGSLYDVDRFLAQPWLYPYPNWDIGIWIGSIMNPAFRHGLRTAPMTYVDTGIPYAFHGDWSPWLTGSMTDILSMATSPDGEQWTVMKEAGRRPVMRLKDRSTVHWTVRCGQPGVQHDLERDNTTAPSMYYGEGVDDNNCRWRNAKYPNITPDDAPVYPGVIYNPGNVYDDNFRMFKNVLISKGYAVSDDTSYHTSEESEIRRFQASYGGLVTGTVAAQTWAGAFEPGSSGGDLTGAYIAPLAWVSDQREVLDYAHGPVTNPDYNPHSVRRETYVNWGAGITKAEGESSSREMLRRFYPADYKGTITLRSDPTEGHRFEIKAGQNILFQNHHGVDRTFHIAHAEVDIDGGTVTLEVDQAGRDALTLAEIRSRNKDNATPTWRRDRTYRNSRQIEDKIASWDCENGSGVIPRHGTFRNLWNVLRIPTSSGGEIIRAEFTLDIPARFSVAVFDRPTTHSELRNYGGTPLEEGYWDQFGDGLVIAWGGSGQAAGYYPGSESNDSALTGRLVDDSSWYYECIYPPWLWVAIWVESPKINYISGRLYPGLF